MRTAIILISIVGIFLYLAAGYFIYGISFGVVLKLVPMFASYVLFAFLFGLIGTCTVLKWPKFGTFLQVASAVIWFWLALSFVVARAGHVQTTPGFLESAVIFAIVSIPALVVLLAAFLATLQARRRVAKYANLKLGLHNSRR